MTVQELRYVELKTGYHDDGPAWIGYVTASRSARTVYFQWSGVQAIEPRHVRKLL